MSVVKFMSLDDIICDLLDSGIGHRFLKDVNVQIRCQGMNYNIIPADMVMFNETPDSLQSINWSTVPGVDEINGNPLSTANAMTITTQV